MANDPNAMLREAGAFENEQRIQKSLVLSPIENEKVKKIENTQKLVNSNGLTKNETRKKEAVDTKALPYDEKMAEKRAQELSKSPISGNFDAKHIKDINKYILQDSKSLNGGQYRANEGEQLRDRRIYGTDKTFKMQFDQGVVDDNRLNAIMKDFGSVEVFAKLDEKMAAEKLSKLYGNLEKLGAFEKGNSKTARTYAEQIAASAGYTVDWTKINQYEKDRAKGLDKSITLEPQQTKNEKVVIKDKVEPKVRVEKEINNKNEKVDLRTKVDQEFSRKAVEINKEFKQSPYAAGKQNVQQNSVKTKNLDIARNNIANRAVNNNQNTIAKQNSKSGEIKPRGMGR